MRVAFLEQESQLGGVEYTTLRVAKSLDRSKFEPRIICPEEGELPRLARQEGLCVDILPRPKFVSVSLFWKKRYFANPIGFLLTVINVLRTASILYQYFRGNPADIVITKGLLAHFYGGLAARRLDLPCIWYMQEEVNAKRAGGFFRMILQQSAKRLAHTIVVDAEALLDQFGDCADGSNAFQVIYNGIDPSQFAPLAEKQRQEARARFGIAKNALVIGQAGRLIPSKGQDILLQAFLNLMRNYPDLHLIFVGAPIFGNSDYEKSLRQQAVQSGFGDHVHFTGFIPDVREGLAAMDIFVHASVETDSPVSVMEAMSCGLPVVVSMVQGTIEMVVPDKDALTFRPGDINMLTAILEGLISCPKLQVEIGAQARTSAIQKFSLETSVAKLQTLIEEVYAG